MTVGLAPVIGITLPFISYGGTSLVTFSVMLFILVRLDADRQMVLR
jgi:rod shape determining protein RodA